MEDKLVSIGYEGLSLDSLISRLRLRGVHTLVDVRLNAISRKRGFSKRALAEALANSGIDYTHLPGLGNHRDNRAGYAEPQSQEGRDARDSFRDVLETPEAISALVDVRERASKGRVAIFCFEADETHCHREQVIDALLGRTLAPA